MKTKNVFLASYLLSYILISGLCIINNQPLIFYPMKYDLFEFTKLAILLGILNIGLIFILTRLEKAKKKGLLNTINAYMYFIVNTSIILFVFTLISGYIESGVPFFYYFCIENSCLYLIGGYITTIFAAFLFARNSVAKNNIPLTPKI